MNPYSVFETPFTTAQALAQRHRILRKHLKLSQAELASRADVSLGSLKRFEQSGKISLENLLKLAHLLDRLDDFKPVFHLNKAQVEAEDYFNKTMTK